MDTTTAANHAAGNATKSVFKTVHLLAPIAAGSNTTRKLYGRTKSSSKPSSEESCNAGRATRAVQRGPCNAGRATRAVQRGPCKVCGCVKAIRTHHAHHEDYAKPLDVTWLCPDCHTEHHRQERLHGKGQTLFGFMREGRP